MYSYFDLVDDIVCLKRMGLRNGIIGYSVAGRAIPYIHLGDIYGKQLLIMGAIHARESITARLIVEQIYYLAKNPDFYGGIYFVPMLNPDGSLLCSEGITSAPKGRRCFLEEVNGSLDFSLWKANLNAVDLNTNFDARYSTGAQNVFEPAPSNFVGATRFSEPETLALAQFTRQIDASMTISYHCKGREIYWQFFQNSFAIERDRKIARAIASHTGYSLLDGDQKSAGGYKDWCIQRLGIPALTIEIISDRFSHPVPDHALLEDWQQNKDVPALALSLLA